MHVTKRRGMEGRDVLSTSDNQDDDVEQESIWSKVGNAVGLGKLMFLSSRVERDMQFEALASNIRSCYIIYQVLRLSSVLFKADFILN